jgi:hypothetical protein
MSRALLGLGANSSPERKQEKCERHTVTSPDCLSYFSCFLLKSIFFGPLHSALLSGIIFSYIHLVSSVVVVSPRIELW